MVEKRNAGKIGLAGEELANAQKILRIVVSRDFAGNHTKAARGLGVAGPSIYHALKGSHGIGFPILIGLKRHLGCGYDDIIAGRETAHAATTPAPTSRVSDGSDRAAQILAALDGLPTAKKIAALEALLAFHRATKEET